MKHIKLTADDLLNGLSITFEPSKSSPKPFEVDWAKVPKYTPILVRDQVGDPWKPRFFAGYAHNADVPFITYFGLHNPTEFCGSATAWKQAKINWLAENAWLPWIEGVKDVNNPPDIPGDTILSIKYTGSEVTHLRTFSSIFSPPTQEFYYMIPSQIEA